MARIALICGGPQHRQHNDFVAEMQRRGHQVSSFWANGDYCSGRLKSWIGNQLDAAPPDVIVASSTPAALAAIDERNRRRRQNIPIVIAVIGNPELNRKVRGTTNCYLIQNEPRNAGSGLARFLAALVSSGEGGPLRPWQPGQPGDTVILLAHGGNPGSVREIDSTTAWFAKNASGVRVEVRRLSCTPNDPYHDAPAVLRQIENDVNRGTLGKVRAILILGDPTTSLYSADVLALAGRLGVATGWESFPAMTAGGTVCWGPARTNAWQQAADIVDELLGGARPGRAQTVPFELTVNNAAAGTLGIRIPPRIGRARVNPWP